ncbi:MULTISPECIES: lipoprotein [Pseudoalteromonas]|jgi:hypothetical protein|uniref:Lipoprotein n=1 Tax=Pseudoalteromonas piratica TaxID=1348114 RepID=A0A0A7EFQ7_9GAMM|nr:lipoprotein [Pseudoalteromonas piratica]AIY65490.1 lipoprotein [Pseudoalteromonas piratica]
MKKLLITAAALLTLTACSKVTLENYEKIKVGQNKEEVEAILGGASKCEEKTMHTDCTWGNDSTNIKVTFVGGKVTLYSEKGL